MPSTPPTVGFVGTYPPTKCGIATFTAPLRRGFVEERESNEGLGVVSLVDSPIGGHPPEVVHEHLNGDRSSLERSVAALDRHDVVLFQHEYGIYGGPDGIEILDLVSGVTSPKIVTFHTVLNHPTPPQRLITETLVDRTDEAIVMSGVGLGRLLDLYDVDHSKVRMIPHGAATSLIGPRLRPGPRPMILTWGLIGPGKGLEAAIDSCVALKDLDPLPRYVILGATHPKVRAAQGDVYLEGLIARVHAHGLDEIVEFDRRYLDSEALNAVVRQADVVLLPYESTEQATSGVLVEAVAAGKPVVATEFPHAVELLAAGAGTVVPHSDPDAMAAALRLILTDTGVAIRMGEMARLVSPSLAWPAVALRYDEMAYELVGAGSPLIDPPGSALRD